MANSMVATDGWQTGLDTLVQGRIKEAIGQLRAFVREAPQSFEGHYFLGTALNQAGHYREAADALQQATQIKPQHGQAHYQLGLALNGSQDHAAAQEQLQQAVQLEPGYEPAQTALAHVTALQQQATLHAAGDTAASSAAGMPLAATLPSALELSFETATPQPPKYVRSLLFGVAAGLLGALLWEMMCIAIHQHVDGLGVLLGGAVGWAVAEGADTRSRSPFGVQILAVCLTALAFGVGEAFNNTGYAIVYAAMAGVALNITATLIASLLSLPLFFLHNPGSLGLMAFTCCWGWLQSSRLWR